MAERRSRLDQPVEAGRRWEMPQTFSEESFGILAEKFARFMGTAKFLVYMTLFIIVWILLNVLGMTKWHWDPYPFILLNLFFSTQASYAAPLILLAQNRQDDRDRVGLERDRVQAERNLADTEYLTREVASLRFALRETATRDYVRSELRTFLEDLIEELDRREAGEKAARKARKARKAARRSGLSAPGHPAGTATAGTPGPGTPGPGSPGPNPTVPPAP